MGRILVTGSAQGLGLMAAQRLIAGGHEVVLHGRNQARGRDAMASAPGAAGVVAGDLSSIAEIRSVAVQANQLGPFSAVIHNAGVGDGEGRHETADGLEHVFAVNVLAPYVLTALIVKPQRLIYLSSGMHRYGDPDFTDLQWKRRRWNGSRAYSDSKLFDLALALAMARRWPGVLANAVDPGWVATRMGGHSAPDDPGQGSETQAWLAASDDAEAQTTGGYWYHRQRREFHRAARDKEFQERLLAVCAQLTSIAIPGAAAEDQLDILTIA